MLKKAGLPQNDIDKIQPILNDKNYEFDKIDIFEKTAKIDEN